MHFFYILQYILRVQLNKFTIALLNECCKLIHIIYIVTNTAQTFTLSGSANFALADCIKDTSNYGEAHEIRRRKQRAVQPSTERSSSSVKLDTICYRAGKTDLCFSLFLYLAAFCFHYKVNISDSNKQ